MKPYYEQDGITIYHGDCREIVPQLSTFEVVIADVPYNQTSLDWDRWPHGWLEAVASRSRSLWCFGSLRLFMLHADEFTAAGWKLSQDLVWEKHNGSGFHADRFRRVHEQIAHFYQGEWNSIPHETPKTHDATARSVRRKGRPAHMGHINATSYESHDGGPRLMRSVIYVPSMHGDAENETQKPEGLVKPLVDYACPRAGMLLSPFCGSGTDLLVARHRNLIAVGIDIREDQCEVAARRLSQQALQFGEAS
jgi:site-specific DNA-methyltransferase (adenine-specific)